MWLCHTPYFNGRGRLKKQKPAFGCAEAALSDGLFPSGPCRT
ncbi:TPA: hypothetical protein ACFP4Y_001496 [Neisseria bacilliformis]|nr:hypothetical protein [Neisseria bacilliformis]